MVRAGHHQIHQSRASCAARLSRGPSGARSPPRRTHAHECRPRYVCVMFLDCLFLIFSHSQSTRSGQPILLKREHFLDILSCARIEMHAASLVGPELTSARLSSPPSSPSLERLKRRCPTGQWTVRTLLHPKRHINSFSCRHRYRGRHQHAL